MFWYQERMTTEFCPTGSGTAVAVGFVESQGETTSPLGRKSISRFADIVGTVELLPKYEVLSSACDLPKSTQVGLSRFAPPSSIWNVVPPAPPVVNVTRVRSFFVTASCRALRT